MLGATQQALGWQVHQAVVEEVGKEEDLKAGRALVEGEVTDIHLQEEEEGEERGHLTEEVKGAEETVGVVDGEEEEGTAGAVGEEVEGVEEEEDQAEAGATAQAVGLIPAHSGPGERH